ncbi:MAG: HAD hydrolase-like protein [Candidatus Omnitrophica bacterium]|nr:HAD hydrolase-like protein [Candidatus Omnitrophota bacterium]
MKSKPPAFNAVIFDIDNVLIDTRHSYLEAIRRTVEIYLTTGSIPFFLPGRRAGSLLLSERDVNQFKLLGGFNDDWDCCHGLLIYLTTLPVKERTMDHLKKVMNISAFCNRITQRPVRTSGIAAILGRPQTVKIEKIARIFQEIYLGKNLFKLVERKNPVYWTKRGLINREKLIFRKATLEKLKSLGVRLGIATGRPRFEATYALKHFGILDFFDAITTIDEVKRAEQEMKQSLRKPHPFSLIETAKMLGHGKRVLYVGDLPDDILAAHQSKPIVNIRSVAFPDFTSHPEETLKELKKLKPDFVLRKASDLPKLVMKGA